MLNITWSTCWHHILQECSIYLDNLAKDNFKLLNWIRLFGSYFWLHCSLTSNIVAGFQKLYEVGSVCLSVCLYVSKPKSIFKFTPKNCCSMQACWKALLAQQQQSSCCLMYDVQQGITVVQATICEWLNECSGCLVC